MLALICRKKLIAWAKPRGLWEKPERHRRFGFNNPSPSAGSPNYGYEVWIAVGPEVEPEGEMRIVHFEGGLYAVARCAVPTGSYEVIGETWKRLVTWREEGKYRHGTHQWLEEHLPLNPPGTAFVLDLYLPIVE